MAAVMDRSVEKPGFLDRASWSALFAGFFVGIGILFLLLSLGAAIGFSAVDPRNFESWRTAGIGVGIWGGISAIIASFFSAWVTGRLSSSWTRLAGVLHGVALWGLTWAVTMWFGAMLVGGVARTAANAAGQAAQSAAQSGQVTPQDVQQGQQQLQQQAQQAQQQLQQNAQAVSEAAESAGAKGAWGAFVAALFTLVASGIGGAAGVGRRRDVVEEGGLRRHGLEPSASRT